MPYVAAVRRAEHGSLRHSIKRIADVLDELREIGIEDSDLYDEGRLKATVLAEAEPSASDYHLVLDAWVQHLRSLHVFFSAPLDLDMPMLTAFPG
jgi:hypothetical protein